MGLRSIQEAHAGRKTGTKLRRRVRVQGSCAARNRSKFVPQGPSGEGAAAGDPTVCQDAATRMTNATIVAPAAMSTSSAVCQKLKTQVPRGWV